ncbi:MAG: hypothetical protein J3K34DRAFT_160757 [Monoraphidium minutum]|nr:MAG: hypothetical protein J3K34DRAFT_160757 [Monoraphidium minutum]
MIRSQITGAPALRAAFAALLLLALGAPQACADCTRLGPFDLRGSSCTAEAAKLDAATACMRKTDALASSFASVKTCTSACSGKMYSLSDLKTTRGAGGSCTYTAKYHCCADVSDDAAAAPPPPSNPSPARTTRAQTPAPAPEPAPAPAPKATPVSTPAPAPAPAPKAPPAPAQLGSSRSALSEIEAGVLGGYSGSYMCDVGGGGMASYFAANSELAIRVLLKEGPGGQIVIQSREQLTRPGFGCKYEWDGVCKIGSHACATGQPVYCTPTSHQVWDSPCGGMVTVPRITHLRLCSTASTGQILEVGTTCARSSGTITKNASPGGR